MAGRESISACKPSGRSIWGQKFTGVPHVCYRIAFDGREVLFTADTDYLHESLTQVAGVSLEAAFVNPLFFQALFDKRLFHGALAAEHIGVYHIPFREDDRMHMRESVRRRLSAPGAENLQVLPLSEPYAADRIVSKVKR